MRNRICYVAILLIVILLDMIFGLKETMIALIAVILLPTASIAIAFVSTRFIVISEETDCNAMTKGDTFNYRLSIKNRLIFPCSNLRLDFSDDSVNFIDTGRLEFTLLPFENVNFNTKAAAKYRGEYLFGIESVRVKDFLGLVSLKIKYSRSMTISVFPRISDLSALLSESDRTVLENFDDRTASDFRTYVPSDSMRHIHWKLTAKSNDIIVKNFENEKAPVNCAIFVDVQRLPDGEKTDAARQDMVVESAVSLLYACMAQKLETDIIFDAETAMKPAYQRAGFDFESHYGQIALVKFRDEAIIDRIIPVYLERVSKGLKLWVITSNLSDVLLHALERSHKSGNNETVFFVVNGEVSEHDNSVVASLKELGIAVIFAGVE